MSHETASPREPSIDESLVRALLESQRPEWARLPLEPVLPGGWDNRTFRLGAEMSVRLPSAACYAEQVAKEQRWLPRLAPGLPLTVPRPLFEGAATRDYPYAWSVYRWLAGEDAERAQLDDLVHSGLALAGFLRALHALDASAGPAPGPHNFQRGGALGVYDAETRDSLELLQGTVDVAAARALWDAALRSCWRAAPVWVHGDLCPSNLLVHDGHLSAVIDFGCLAVGDPACDLCIAWTFFHGASRRAFRDAIPLDEDCWLRARGWALWKALITLARPRERDRAGLGGTRRLVEELLAD